MPKITEQVIYMPNLSIKTVRTIHEMDAELWNQLSHGKPFQSHQWYAFGEKVMSDCLPFYLLAYDGDVCVARASLWLIRNEPIPNMLGPLRPAAGAIFKRWPLLICRSPLSYTTGLAFADDARHAEIVPLLSRAALQVASQQKASFVFFDYLSKADVGAWSAPFSGVSDLDPGMCLQNRWNSMDEYMAAGHKKDRQHYKRVLRKAKEMGIKIERHLLAEDMDEALRLIRNVEQNHGTLPNPWARRMLEYMQMVQGTFLTARMENRLVGCGLILEDNETQMTSVLGLARDIPYVYFMLLYESLQMAFERHLRLLRWGSGAYEIKQRLGFSLEDNGALVFTATHPFLQKALKWLS